MLVETDEGVPVTRFPFNKPTAITSLADYKELEADPSYDSAVLIRVQHESWSVLQEFGTEGLSITCSPLGVFHLETAPELVLV
jgi:hypothetical protein